MSGTLCYPVIINNLVIDNVADQCAGIDCGGSTPASPYVVTNNTDSSHASRPSVARPV